MALRSKTAIPFLFMALFWNGIVGVFDVVLLGQLFHEHDARTRFEQVQARVVSSEVIVHRDSEGSTYKPELEYSYQFDGQAYRSDRYSFSSMATSNRGYAEEVCGRYKEGSVVTAYVDPDSPDQAALDVSGDSFPTAALLFLTPFHCIGLLLIGGVITALRKPRGPKDEEGRIRARYVRVDTGDHVVIGRPRMWPPLIFVLTLMGVSFVAMFATVIPFGFRAPMGTVLGALASCVGLSAFVAYRHWKGGKAPKNFLHVDRGRGTFAFPANGPGQDLDSIESIIVEPTSTGVTINDVEQFKHCFEAETSDGLMKLFEMKAGRNEGDEVLNLLRIELLSDS